MHFKFIVYRAFAHDVTAAMLVFQFKIILIRLFFLSGTPTWPPWFLLSWSQGNECKRSIRVLFEQGRTFDRWLSCCKLEYTGCIKKRRPLEINHIVKI